VLKNDAESRKCSMEFEELRKELNFSIEDMDILYKQ